LIQKPCRNGTGGGNDGDGAAVGAVQQIGDQFLARVPAFGGSPAIVHHQHQRAGSRQLGTAAQQRIGQGDDQQCRRQKAQQQQPPGRGGWRLFFIFQPAQQPQRRKKGSSRTSCT